MSLLDKLKKGSRVKEVATMEESRFYQRESTPTDVPMLNVALSGELDGGLVSGVTVLAGPSKHFKSSFALKMAASYMENHDDAVCLFYDTEFGSPSEYFKAFGIDTKRVLHVPVLNVEEIKFDLVHQLATTIEENDKVIVVIDSIGNAASKKELEDAMNEKSVADMSRAKAIKGLFRMVTPLLRVKDIPLIVVNHTYQEMGLFPKAVVSGGTGIYYSADTIWILGRRQNKDTKSKEVSGYDFVINVEKSRYVKEKAKIPITVSWAEGIEKYSGLLDIALLSGHVIKPSMGWYQKVDTKTGEVVGSKLREKDLKEAEFWEDILADQSFKDFVRNVYMIRGESEVNADEVVDNADT